MIKSSYSRENESNVVGNGYVWNWDLSSGPKISHRQNSQSPQYQMSVSCNMDESESSSTELFALLMHIRE